MEEDAPDEAWTTTGDGSPDASFVIDELPFTDLRNTAMSPHSNLSSYTGCEAQQDESGGEYLYELVLDKPTRIRAMVFDRGDVDVDIHLLDETATEAGCLMRACAGSDARTRARAGSSWARSGPWTVHLHEGE